MRTIASCIGAALLAALVLRITSAASSDDAPAWSRAERLGGNATVYSYGESPFNQAMPGLSLPERRAFARGAEEFHSVWMPTEAGTTPAGVGRFGLGPDYNATSCAACHFRDGRGLTQPGPLQTSPLTFRDPSTGSLLHHFVNGKARVPPIATDLEVSKATLPDGTVHELRQHRALFSGAPRHLDARSAPAVFGLGLLEAVDDNDLREAAERQTFRSEGIRGVTRQVAAEGASVLGRFGLKSDHATLDSQLRSALHDEMGVTTDGGSPEISPEALGSLLQYLRLLGVPARRDVGSPALVAGARLFQAIGCAMCHTPSLRTGDRSPFPELRRQTIYPFTDLLLHDMGEGLAEGSGVLRRMWRTAPLWGIGTQELVSPQAGYLHDGRARDLIEAVLWHGGDAQRVRDRFVNLSRADRERLIQFLRSL